KPARRRLQPVCVETREAEDRVGGGAESDLAVECVAESVEQVACRPHDGRNPGGGENVAERPDRPSDVVADVRLVQPAAVIAHEVAHPTVVGGCVKEGERAVEMRRPDLLVPATGEPERDDGEPGAVVDAVAAVAVGNDSVR